MHIKLHFTWNQPPLSTEQYSPNLTLKIIPYIANKWLGKIGQINMISLCSVALKSKEFLK